ncbi:YqhG family protein [Heyndrickxia coagulans]|uniref:YqhG family protein n=1 Tax=Heyndrickxia coagulans TaxID=1398 RepID=UPI001F43B6E5|nr:YqhG family protein [Heyndrickxia coagulans]UJZ86331.1 YqhG family protein [Heyndrickxia coagulans]
MLQEEIHQYLERFFEANGAVLVENRPGWMTVQLTVELDKALMNRPFYWSYLEKTGGIPNPMTVTFITDREKAPDTVKGEPVHFGSPRLNQIFETAKQFSRYIRLFEDVRPRQKQVPLYPWLGMNAKISYRCDLKKDVFRSIGLNLIHGTMAENFQDLLEQRALTPKIPDYCFTLTPIIMPKSAVKRIEQYIRQGLSKEPHHWAEEAVKRWHQDLALLDHFYEDMEERPESYEIEKQALKEQYEPKITVHVLNGGLFYLKDAFI